VMVRRWSVEASPTVRSSHAPAEEFTIRCHDLP
jgi:hypothetical protein